METLAEGVQGLGAVSLEARRVTHTDSSFGFRVAPVDGGPGLVYSGDCGRAEDLDALVRPGDTLLCEVSFGPGPVIPGPEHLDGPAVGELARRTRAGRVLLTHLLMGFHRGATVDSVRAHFDGGPVDIVDPGFETMVSV
jgi:ribonuclease BN (tRNA processing enzyme)